MDVAQRVLDSHPVAELGVTGGFDSSPAVPERANPNGFAVFIDAPFRH